MPKIIRVINGKIYSFDAKENASYEYYAKEDFYDLVNEVEEMIIEFIEKYGIATEEQLDKIALKRLPQGVVDRIQIDLVFDEGKFIPEETYIHIVEGEEEKVLEYMIERLIKLSEEQDE